MFNNCLYWASVEIYALLQVLDSDKNAINFSTWTASEVKLNPNFIYSFVVSFIDLYS